MNRYVVVVVREVEVTALSPYQAVGIVLRNGVRHLTESDIQAVAELVPQPQYLRRALVRSSWAEATNEVGEGLGYPEFEKEARS